MGAHSDAMVTRMLARGFAPRTRHAYLGWMRRLVRYCRRPADQLGEQQVVEYLADLARRGRSGSTIRAVSISVRQPSSAFSERAPRC